MFAVANGCEGCVRVLLENGTQQVDEALCSGMMLDHLGLVKLLVEKGANVNYKEGTPMSPLTFAVTGGN